jgi:hypothetical protein
MLDKPKKSNKSRFSVDIGKKYINNCLRVFWFFPLAIFKYKRCKIAFALVKIKIVSRNSSSDSSPSLILIHFR